MERKWVQKTTLGLGALSLLCWVVMFMAGTDIWHDTGRPDLLNLKGASYTDVRTFAIAFYLLPAILFVHLSVTAAAMLTARSGARKAA